MKKRKTERGFDVINFSDRNGTECTLQKSSIATENCIWLGAEKIGLKHFKAGEGWKDVDFTNTIQEHYIANNRMHLTQKQVIALLPHLQRFAKTGEL